MPQDYSKQPAAYHGIKNTKYAMRGADGAKGTEVKSLPFAKSVGFDPTVEQQPVYANDSKVLAIVSDNGYTGTVGTTGQDRTFETALGHIMPVDGGIADINQLGFKRCDFYYEYQEETATGIKYTVKVWALNVEFSKANKNHATDQNQATIGEYSYPITVYGDKIMDAAGTAVYKDAYGNELTATRIISVPSDKTYTDFEKTVPTVKMASAT
ncbi:hypothetical protein RBG61_01960 [Paludicola sp. MB14-C6]|uniref:hypothetical protein n=1 Tax=Paludihabitans sp. MB14-C6 TaxID=3070656 RepID=UPI0027DBE640|nr:hypothetical protein [Paludicola sp. MB14-C6]WMJ23456.1 hypothetical protein RBG61_01960 [Paludicola sp. MB14-C6]